MNVLLWILQVALALLYLAGGGFKTFRIDDVAQQVPAIPRGAWPVLGVIEMVGGVLLIVPLAASWMPGLTALAATVLALETLGLAAVYARYSLKLTPANPLIWAAVMGLLVAFVAYGRYTLSPPS